MKWSNENPHPTPHTYSYTTQLHPKIIIIVIKEWINHKNKQTNPEFSILLSHRPIFRLECFIYLPGLLKIKDKPGLTRLTWNTDWAFLEKKNNRQRIRQNKKNQLSAPSVANFWFNKPTTLTFYYFTIFYMKWVISDITKQK